MLPHECITQMDIHGAEDISNESRKDHLTKKKLKI